MRAIALNLMLAALLPMLIASPHIGLLGYYWISYMGPQHLAWGGVDLPWAKIVALLSIVAWLLSRSPKQIPVNPITVLLLLFTAWTAFTLCFALFPDPALAKAGEFYKIVLVTVFATAVINTRQRLQALIWIICLSLGCYAVKGGLFVILTAGAHHVLGPPKSPFSETNGMARAIVMTLPLLYFLYLHSANRLTRTGLILAILLSIAALIGTNSRGGFMAFFGMLCFLWLYSRRKAKLLVMALGAVLVGFVALPQDRLAEWTNRIKTIENYDEDLSVQGRFEAWSFAMRVAAERPLTGGGFAAFRANVSPANNKGVEYTEAHSNYFEVLGEHGYIGLTMYLLLVAAALISNASCRRMARTIPELYWARDLAILLQAALVGYLVGGLTISDAFLELYYSLLAMSIILRQIVRQAVKARVRQPTTLGAEPTPVTASTSPETVSAFARHAYR